MIKECIATAQGISCFTSRNSIYDVLSNNKYIHGYFIFRLCEILVKDIINESDELKKINYSIPLID